MTRLQWELYHAAQNYLADHPGARDDEVAVAAGLDLGQVGHRGILQAAREVAADEAGPGVD